MSATARYRVKRTSWKRWVVYVVVACGASWSQPARAGEVDETAESQENRIESAGRALAGVAVGLLSHEGGHLLLDVVFDADPGFRRVEFAGVPFFAITHRADLSPRREYAVSAAGFWTQYAVSEWVLSAHPRLRAERRPFLKGLLAWHVMSSAIYTVAALGRIGPHERDTRGMAAALGTSERWIGALVVVPAVCDTWRFLDPDARWPRWLSRSAKIALLLAVARARR